MELDAASTGTISSPLLMKPKAKITLAMSRKEFEGPGGLRGVLNVGDVVHVRRFGRCGNDREDHDVRVSHAREDVETTRELLHLYWSSARHAQWYRRRAPSDSSRICSIRLARCQKKRYGEIVVPNTASNSKMYALWSSMCGITA